MTAPLLRIDGLTKSYGALKASDAVSLDLLPGEIHAVIGPNGAGKTTLIGQVSGEIPPDAGSIALEGRRIERLPAEERARLGLGRSYQVTSILPRFTVLENALLAAQAKAGSSFRFWRPVRQEAGIGGTAMAALERVGLAGRAGENAGALSHGEHRQLEIAMALAGSPRVLLLDEPAAGMGREDTARLIELLAGLKGELAILLVEHDMDAVFALADRITVLVYGRVIASGPPAAIRADAEVRRAYLGEEDAA